MHNINTIEGVISLFSYSPTGEIDPKAVYSAAKDLSSDDLNKLRSWLLSKGCSERAIKRAERDWHIKIKIGSEPNCVSEFIEGYVRKNQVVYLKNGLIEYTAIDSKLFSISDIADMSRQLRIINSDLRLGFEKSIISDGIDAWREDQRKNRVLGAWRGIDNPNSPNFEHEWLMLVSAIFDTGQASEGYFVAALKKVIWQIKRKMQKIEISNHLMPVLSGPQGNGKTTFVEKFLSPISGLESKANFESITDVRSGELFSSYAIFVDEMEKANKADVEAIKGVITAATLDRRILGTNRIQTISQNAVFIGASNSALGANIRDTTGLRRFAPLPTLPKQSRHGASVNWAAINDTDFAALWQSVQVDAEDPMADYASELEALQNQERVRSVTEQWLDQFNPYTLPSPIVKNGQVKANDLFKQFDLFQSTFATASARIGLEAWGREMAALLSNNAVDYPFTRKRSARGWNYVINSQSVRNVVALAGQQLSR